MGEYLHTPISGSYALCDWNGKIGQLIKKNFSVVYCSECRKEVGRIQDGMFKFHDHRVAPVPVTLRTEPSV